MHAGELILIGLSMGMLHVLLGPDHLSALAALSIGTSWKALYMGIKWGLGHSAGLIVVAIIFISAKGDIDLRSIGKKFDYLVGIFMIIIGLYGFIQLYYLRKERNIKKDIDIEKNEFIESTDKNNNNNNNNNNDKINIRKLQLSKVNSNNNLQKHNTYIYNISTETEKLIDNNNNNNNNNINNPGESSVCVQHALSFSVGLVHGAAGPGGVLGVLPALEMTRPGHAALYLGAFVAASTLSMGLFAAVYGELTKRVMNSSSESWVEYVLRIFSCGISILVGILWIVLSYLGKLEDFFH